MQKEVNEEGCRKCKYIFIFAFTFILGLFVLTYLSRELPIESTSSTATSTTISAVQ